MKPRQRLKYTVDESAWFLNNSHTGSYQLIWLECFNIWVFDWMIYSCLSTGHAIDKYWKQPRSSLHCCSWNLKDYWRYTCTYIYIYIDISIGYILYGYILTQTENNKVIMYLWKPKLEKHVSSLICLAYHCMSKMQGSNILLLSLSISK